MMRPCAADTLRLGSIACSLRACPRLGSNIWPPARSNCGRRVCISVAAGRNAGDVAAARLVVATGKLRNTLLPRAESTEDKLAEIAAGSLKSTCDRAAFVHAGTATKPSHAPPRNRYR